MKRIYNYSVQQELLHINYGEIDKCIDMMCELIHYASDDKELISQAKNGILKRDIKVADSEVTSKAGRKAFMINCLNTSVSLKNKNFGGEVFNVHILSNYRCFCFHLSKIDDQLGMIELINKTIPEDKQIDARGKCVKLCCCNIISCRNKEVTNAYSKCKCSKGRMEPVEPAKQNSK